MSNRQALHELLSEAIEQHRAGDLNAAQSLYREVLAINPEQFDALRLLGLLLHTRGTNEEAAALLERAVAANPIAAEAFNELGIVQRACGRVAPARTCFERAISLRPNFVDARINLALLLRADGRLEQAQAEFEGALALAPGRPDIHANLGVVQQEQGNLPAAIESYRKALSLNPELAEPRVNLAQALEAQGDLASGAAEIGEFIRRNPGNADAQVLLGGMLHAQGRRVEALECFQRAITLDPGYAIARWRSTMSELAVVYGPGEFPDASRAAFAASLAELERWVGATPPSDASLVVGSMQPYYLAYHEQNNRDLLARYGDLCANLMQQWWASQGLVRTSAAHGHKPRVGIVSGRIFDQSVWTAIVKGWCQHLDQQRLDLHLLYTGTTVDRETQLARSLVPKFIEAPKSLRHWVDEILARRFDVLIYPEIGMGRIPVRLASLRLAPVQVAAWGHPETTGLPTIDYYLSADAFEPPGAQAYYREQLIALPGLGCCCDRHSVATRMPALDGQAVDPSSVLLLCAGTPYKYDPRHDAVLIEIVRRVRNCRFVFFDDVQPNVSRILQRRLESVFANAGLEFARYGTFVPHQDRSSFLGWMGRADLCLDTIGFSGFNTTMQAIECGLPIVAYEGRFMRGRFASGILRHIGLPELVATTTEQYVDLVATLANNESRLQQLRNRIWDAGQTLFGDASPVAALEDFIERVARPG